MSQARITLDVEVATRRISRRAKLGLSFICVLGMGFLAQSVVAAAAVPQLLRSIVSEGTAASAAGGFEEITGIGTDPRNGHIYGLDAGNNRVDEFTPWGEFVKAFGWDVAPGAVNEQQEVRIRATSGQFQLTFGANTTGDLAFDAPANESEEEPGGPESVEAALNALPSIATGGSSVTVEGHPGNATTGLTPFVFVIAFDQGPLAGTNVAQVSVVSGTIPLAGGSPSTEMESTTRADGTAAGTGLESCTTESGCREGTSGSGAGQIVGSFEADAGWGLGVDAGGNVYVADRENHRVMKFSSSGRFLLMFGGEVDKTSGANVCTAVSGDTCGAGVIGTAPGEFSALPRSNVVAVAPSGAIYVGDRERIQVFAPDGTFTSQIPLPGKFPSALSFTQSGNLLADFNEGDSNNTSIPDVRELTPTGSLVRTLTVAYPNALVETPDNIVYVVIGTPPFSTFSKREIIAFDSSGNAVIPVGTYFGSAGPLAVARELSSLATNTSGDLIVSGKPNGSGSRLPSTLDLYGPPPIEFESPPRLPPEIASQFATSVGTGEATVQARINPKFWTDAHYQVEFGTSDCAGGGCAKVPASPQLLTESSVSAEVKTGTVSLAGLAPNTVYHYRFVATSSGGSSVGSDRTFRTAISPAGNLPDQRVYEMVSPTSKGGAEAGVLKGSAPGGIADLSVQPLQASPSGAAVTYSSVTSFGNAEGAPGSSQYLATRNTRGWTTENIGPRFEEGYTRDPLVGFTPDLSHGVMVVVEPPLTPVSYQSLANVYLRDNSTRGVTALTTEPPVPRLFGSVESFCLIFGGASLNGDHVAFGALDGALLSGDPTAAQNGFNLYEWTPSSGTKLLSLFPDGTPAPPSGGTAVGGTPGKNTKLSVCDAETVLGRHAVSQDGARVVWSFDGSYEEGGKTIAKPLFDRVGGAQTVRLDKPNVDGPKTGGGEGQYWDASLDGSKVFLTTPLKLTAQGTAAGSPNLYRYDFNLPDGERLENLTPHTGEGPNVLGVLGASADGSYVYFTATGVLAPGGESGKPNLYAWHEGEGLKYVATLTLSGDSKDWEAELQSQTARVTPDGLHLAFLSRQSLTGYDNRLEGNGEPVAEAYIYDYQSGDLVCGSCSTSGVSPLGPAVLPGWRTPYEQPRYLSDDGARLFFTTPDALDPQDTNGRSDLYEFERLGTGTCASSSPSFSSDSGGCQFLISSGTSGDSAYFVDASADGNDVFLSTRDRLDPYKDQDGLYDIYDARVNGTPPMPPMASCEGSCPGPGSRAPSPSQSGTASFVGPENTKRKPPPCRKGTRKVVKNGKRKCVQVKKKTGKAHHKKHQMKKGGSR